MALTKVTYSMIDGGLVYVKDYGAVGDGTTDDTAAWQAAAAAASGKVLLAESNKTYKLTATVALQENTILDLQGSTLNFNINGTVKCLQANNYCTIANGKIKNFGTTLNIAGNYQCPVVAESKHDIVISNMTIDSDWTQGLGIGLAGGTYNVTIDNIEIPDGSQMNCPISAEWTGDTTRTYHPHSIVVRNVNCGNLRTDSVILYFSSAYDIVVENVSALKCGTGVTWYAGDYTNMYADPTIAHLIGTGLSVKNLNCPSVYLKGIDCRGQSYNPSIVSPPTTPLELNGVFENCDFWARSDTWTAWPGASLEYVTGVELLKCRFRRFNSGVTSSTYAYNVTIRDCVFTFMYTNGIYCSFSSPSAGKPKGWLIDHNVFTNCNAQESNSYGNAALYIGTSENIVATNNIFGDPLNTEPIKYAIYIQDAARYPVLEGNYTRNLNDVNVAYLIGSNFTQYDINAIGSTNAAAATTLGGQPIVAFFHSPLFTNMNGIRSGLASEGSKPSTGTWNTGDKLYLNTPTSTIIGWVCTTAGTGSTTSGGTAVWRDITA